MSWVACAQFPVALSKVSGIATEFDELGVMLPFPEPSAGSTTTIAQLLFPL